MAWDFNTDDTGEQILEGNPILTDDNNIPITQITMTQPEPCLPCACRANTSRFFPDDVEEVNAMPLVVHPQLKPHPIVAQ
jgi:hypothetical protein